MKQITNRLSFKVLGYLIFFSFVILAIIWFLQVFSLRTFYEVSVKRKIYDVADQVKENYNKRNYQDILNQISFKNNMCIQIYESTMNVYSSISCYKESVQLTNEKRNFIFNNTQEEDFEQYDSRVDGKFIMSGFKLENGLFAFVQVRLEPVDSTVEILKNQLLIVSFVVAIFSIGISFFLSKRISKPIEKINENAKKIVNGKYDLSFDDDTTISEIKELNKTLKYTSDELSKTEHLRREFMSNVSHDLKTPLTMIKAYAEMVRDLTYKDKKKRENNLNVIIEESDRLNLLVNDILDLSKYQANTIELEKSEFDLNDLIKEIINRYDIYKSKNGFKINYKGKKCLVYADRKRMEQVIYNLLNNAINYSGEDKVIKIELVNDSDIARVNITNTGEGIKEEDLPLIWDKYYKIDKTYSRVQVGSGIGLSIVKNILELPKFKYGVLSEVNKYTTFYFEIPVIKNK